jgi:hypothetical protein
MVRLPLVAIALNTIACGASTPGPEFGHVEPGLADEDPQPAPKPAVASGEVSCYFGGLFVTPAGEPENHEGELLIKLTWDHAASTLTEETFSFPLFERWQVTRAIRGRTFTSRQDDGAFAGAGELDGDPGHWSAWRSTTTSSDGGVHVESATRMVDGVLVAEEKVTGADGSLRHTLRYALEPIERHACDDMFARAQAAVDEARARAAAADKP